MEFRILGPLQAVDNGRAVPLGGAKQRALLTLLLLHANETISRDRLIDELWGARPPATAAKTVQVHISRLRKALEDSPMLMTREHGYTLAIDPEALDAKRFERLLGVGSRELAAGRPDHAVPALRSALSLWRGSPLSDLAHEPFAQSEIGRLEELRLAAFEQLIESKLALGRTCRGRRAARGADRRASLPRAPASSADARALSLRAPGGGAAGLPGRTPDAGR